MWSPRSHRGDRGFESRLGHSKGRRALVSQAGCNPAVFGRWRFDSVPTHSNGQVVKLEYTRRSERRALRRESSNLSLATDKRSRVSQRSAGPHKPGPSGATPEPANISTKYEVQSTKRCETTRHTFVLRTLSFVLIMRAARPTERYLACNQEIGVRLPGGPLNSEGLMVQREDIRLAV